MASITRRIAFFALGVIFIANFFNYIDRQLVAALERPIRDTFHLTSQQFGYLHTLFTVGYMLCAAPIGFLADHFNRVRLLSGCIIVWSIATVASGAAEASWILYIARVFIGVGEAGCLVIGPSLISDYFSQGERGRALSIFYLGLPLGGTAAYIMAGVFFDFGWNVMFYIAGVPGFIVAGVLLLFPDPPRGSAGAGAHGGGHTRFRDYLQLLRTPTLLWIILAQAFAVIMLVPLLLFGVGFFEASRGMGEKSARIALGIIALVAGGLGNTLSGIIGDRLFRRGIKGAYTLLAGIAFLVGWPFMLMGFTIKNPWIFLPAITIGAFCYFLCMPAVNTQIANVVRPDQRSTAWALAVFLLHLLGDTAAPPVFGKVEMLVTRQTAFLSFSFGLVLAGLCCLIAFRTAARDVERANGKAS